LIKIQREQNLPAEVMLAPWVRWSRQKLHAFELAREGTQPSIPLVQGSPGSAAIPSRFKGRAGVASSFYCR
jgi:hypothetical protein